jgi:cytochrome c oxidase cbb3-type subunit 3
MKGKSIVAAVVTAIILGGSWVSAQSAKGDPKNGQLVYEQNCLRCHGLSLEGDGPDGRFLVVAPANLQSVRSRAKTDWELLLAISHGVAFSPMHGWRDRLTQEQILDVLAYIRMMAPSDVVS